MSDCQNSLLNRGIRANDYIVLVLTKGILSFLSKNPNNFHRNILKPDGLTNRIKSFSKEILDNCLTNNHHFCSYLDLMVIKHSS